MKVEPTSINSSRPTSSILNSRLNEVDFSSGSSVRNFIKEIQDEISTRHHVRFSEKDNQFRSLFLGRYRFSDPDSANYEYRDFVAQFNNCLSAKKIPLTNEFISILNSINREVDKRDSIAPALGVGATLATGVLGAMYTDGLNTIQDDKRNAPIVQLHQQIEEIPEAPTLYKTLPRPDYDFFTQPTPEPSVPVLDWPTEEDFELHNKSSDLESAPLWTPGKTIHRHPALNGLLLSPVFRTSDPQKIQDDNIKNYHVRFKVKSMHDNQAKIPDFFVDSFFIPDPRKNRTRSLAGSVKELQLDPPFWGDSAPINHFEITIPGVKNYFIDQSKTGIPRGTKFHLKTPFGYKIYGINDLGDKFDHVYGSVFEALEDIPLDYDITYHVAPVKYNIPDENNDNRVTNLTKEEKVLRYYVSQNLSNPENLKQIMKAYIEGSLPDSNGNRDMTRSNAFIYVYPESSDSHISQILQDLTKEELRELKITQCELNSSNLYDLLHDLMPCAVAAGSLIDPNDKELYGEFGAFSIGGHARFVFEDANKQTHLFETVGNEELRSAHDGVDIPLADFMRLKEAISNWRSIPDTELETKEKWRSFIRDLLEVSLITNKVLGPSN